MGFNLFFNWNGTMAKAGRGKARTFKPESVKWNPRGSAIQRHWDSSCPGLALNVKCAPGDRRVTGLKTWDLRYDFDGKSKIGKIGRYPQLDMQDARDLALKLKNEAAKGRDPREILKYGLSSSHITVRELVDRMLKDERYPMSKLSEGYRNNFYINMRKHVLPLYGGRDVESLEAEDWLHIVDKHIEAKRYGAAKNILGYAGSFYKNAQAHPLLRTLRNPMIGLTVHIPGSQPRERVLSFEELKQVWDAFPDNNNWQAVIRLLMLTGQRIGNVLAMRWDRIEDGIWAVGTKGEIESKKGEHKLPITPEMNTLIESMRGAHQKWVFAGYTAKHLSHGAILQALHLYLERTGMEQFTAHDMRRSFITHANEAGLDYLGIKRVVHHSIGGVTETVYAHGQYLDLKRKVLEDWTDLLREKGVI
jgi:integrase